MSPSTRCIRIAALLALLSACGEPPQAMPTAPPYVPASLAPETGAVPTIPPVTLPPPTYPVYTAVPTLTVPVTTVATTPPTTVPTTVSPTPTPSHAPACVGEPTGKQILTLIKNKKGVPAKPLKVDQGPLCSGDWSFTTVEIDGKNEDDVEPLMVLATGKGTTLTFVAAGSDVCSNRVQTTAPPGIRVLACGF